MMATIRLEGLSDEGRDIEPKQTSRLPTMSDHEIDLGLVQIALKVGFACAVAGLVVVGGFFFVRFLAGSH
ncbi:hypothetical protein [Bradyrhizobium sp.]|uniref:hypothetical protein n=1 Tax=Bradyrhizobium sp. TaxID=376 RepID=UPI003C1FEEC1